MYMAARSNAAGSGVTCCGGTGNANCVRMPAVCVPSGVVVLLPLVSRAEAPAPVGVKYLTIIFQNKRTQNV